MIQQPSRARLQGTAAALAALGVLFVRVLVADSDDNAYLYLTFVGGGLVVAALPFTVAALLPTGSVRRLVVRGAQVFLALVGALGMALLLFALAIIPSQNYRSNTVLLSHIVGLIALVAASVVLWRIYRQHPR